MKSRTYIMMLIVLLFCLGSLVSADNAELKVQRKVHSIKPEQLKDIGLRYDPGQHPVAGYRQPTDFVVRHDPRSVLDRRIDIHRDHVLRHDGFDRNLAEHVVHLPDAQRCGR